VPGVSQKYGKVLSGKSENYGRLNVREGSRGGKSPLPGERGHTREKAGLGERAGKRRGGLGEKGTAPLLRRGGGQREKEEQNSHVPAEQENLQLRGSLPRRGGLSFIL